MSLLSSTGGFDFSLSGVSVSLQVTGSPRVSEEMFVSVEFTNPFKFNLENVDLRMEGPGIMPFKHKQYR